MTAEACFSFHKISRLLANKVKITTKATLSNDIVVILNGVRSSAMLWLMLFHLYYRILQKEEKQNKTQKAKVNNTDDPTNKIG
jgi:hypothetical protein